MLIAGMLILTSYIHLQAQFMFTYDGPDTISVDDNCVGILDWGHPNNPRVESTDPDADIVIFEILRITDDYEIGDTIPPGTLVTVIYIAFNDNDESERFPFTIRFLDTTPPRIFADSLPALIDLMCIDELPPVDSTSVRDNCTSYDDLDLTFTETELPDPCIADTVIRSWIAIDEAGNRSTFTQTYAIAADMTPPVIITPLTDAEGQCGSFQDDYIAWIAEQREQFLVDDDGCGLQGITDNAPDSISLVGEECLEVEVIFTGMDICGRSVSDTATFSYIDTIAPMITVEAMDMSYACDTLSLTQSLDRWISSQGGAEAEDNCCDIEWSFYTGLGALSGKCIDSAQYFFVAQDCCGLRDTTSAWFFVTDTIPPTLDMPAMDARHYCGDSVLIESALLGFVLDQAGAIVTDACTDSLSLVVTVGDSVLSDSMEILAQLALGDIACIDTVLNGVLLTHVIALIDVNFCWQDACGQSVCDTATFIAVDTLGPVLDQDMIQDTITYCDDIDDVERSISDWYDALSLGGFTDDCSNITTIVSLSLAEAIEEFYASGSTECGSGGSVRIDITSSDDCGNLSADTLVATYTLVDTLEPVFRREAINLTSDCGTSVQEELESWIARVGDAVIDNLCSTRGVSFDWLDSQGDTGTGILPDGPFPQISSAGTCDYDVEVSWVVADSCYDTIRTAALFDVMDDAAPIFTPASMMDLVISCDSSFSQIDTPVVTAMDICTEAVIVFTESSTFDPDAGVCENYSYTISRQWIATDDCGNSDTLRQLITVVDDEGPSFLVPADITLDCGQAADTARTGVPTDLMDDCSGAVSIVFADVSSGAACDSVIERSWTATDLCGNSTTQIQTIVIQDLTDPRFTTSPQNINIACSLIGGAESLFDEWKEELAFARGTDDCSSITAFVAEASTIDLDDPSTFPGSIPDDLPDPMCSSDDSDEVVSLDAIIVLVDACGNYSSRTASFNVIDTRAPVLISCGMVLSQTATSEDCSALLEYSLPVVEDACLRRDTSVMLVDTFDLVSDNPGDLQVPVSDILTDLGYSPTDPLTIIDGSVSLTITVINADIDDPGEYLLIAAENGDSLGRTALGPSQCSGSTVTITLSAAQLQEMLADNLVELLLSTHQPDPLVGSTAINDICGGSRVAVSLSFSASVQSDFVYTVRIDALTPVTVDNPAEVQSVVLASGPHTLAFTASDCSGNSTSCTISVDVTGGVGPQIVCPQDTIIYLDADTCMAAIALPWIASFDDSCGTALIYADTSTGDGLLEFSQVSTTGAFVADDEPLSFVVTPSTAVTDATLTVLMTGDVDEFSEYFTVIGENGEVIDDTQVSLPETDGIYCDSVRIVSITIPAVLLREWALDGQVDLIAQSFRELPVPPSTVASGINPCDSSAVMADGDQDGTSRIRAELRYEYAVATYSTSGASDIGPVELFGDPAGNVVSLSGGLHTITYRALDEAGNFDECSFIVDVRDTIAPVAVCAPLSLTVSPAGDTISIEDASVVDGGSTDACGDLTFSIIDNGFDCTQVGDTVPTTLVVTDRFGNSDSCVAMIEIVAPILEPTFSIDICDGDSLMLIANAPPGDYTYRWTGPGSFVSDEINPVIIGLDDSLSGTYSLTITGPTACMLTGSVTIVVEPFVRPIVTGQDSLCLGDLLVLTTQQVSGDVSYEWYVGAPGSGILIQITSDPMLTLDPDLGTEQYYVIIRTPLCVSDESEVFVNVVSTVPEAMIAPIAPVICEGDTIDLVSATIDPSLTYTWIGPNGFTSALADPAPISNATIAASGEYQLITRLDGCSSDTASVRITVRDAPDMPFIDGDQLTCEGGSLTLIATGAEDATAYIWTAPDGTLINTTDSVLMITDLDGSERGFWTVVAVNGGCVSPTSVPYPVIVEPDFDVTAGNTGPGCLGDSLTLTVDSIGGATYSWQGPLGFMSSERMPRISAVEGSYVVTVSLSGGCVDLDTTVVISRQPPIITALSNTAESCVDSLQDIQLLPTVFPFDTGSYTYTWIGPNGFTSDLASPTLLDVDGNVNGEYILVVSDGECSSQPDTTVVDIQAIPEAPVIVLLSSSACLGEPLEIVSLTSDDSYIYTWSTPDGTVITGDTLQIESAQSGEYSLIITSGSCTSEVSNVLTLNLASPPPQPNAFSLFDEYCVGENIELLTDFFPDATYEWILEGEVISMDQNPMFPASLSSEGEYRVRIIVDGCGSEFSDPVSITVLQSAASPEIESLPSLVCGLAGNELIICLDPDSIDVGEEFIWILTETDRVLQQSTDSCLRVRDYTGFVNGFNEISVARSNSPCENASITLVNIDVTIPEQTMADGGADQTVCLDVGFLEASEIQVGQGAWSAADDDIQFDNRLDPSTSVSGLPVGNTELVWSLATAGCGVYSTDTIIVTRVEDVVAIDDAFAVSSGETALAVLDNDMIGDEVMISIIGDPTSGTARVSGDMIFYTPTGAAATDEIVYEICYVLCPDVCASATVSLDIDTDQECIITNVLTANNDGVNDAIIIDCVDNPIFSGNRLVIFNIYGDEIYSAAPYQNDWRGEYNGEPLPVGTYYYLFDRGDGSSLQSGFITLKR